MGLAIGFLARYLWTKQTDEQYLSSKEAVYSLNQLFEEHLVDEQQCPGNYLTYGSLGSVLRKMDIHSGKRTLGKSKERITKKEWGKLLKDILKQQGMQDTVEEKTLDIFTVVDSGDSKLIVTDSGNYSYISTSSLKEDIRIHAMIRENTIIYISTYEKSAPRYENLLITQIQKNNMTLSVNGIERTFQIKGISQDKNNTLCDIRLKHGKIEKLYIKGDIKKGKVLSMEPEQIEIEGYGKMKRSDTCRYLKQNGDSSLQTADETLMKVGDEDIQFVIADKVICGMIKSENGEDKTSKTVRVLLKNTGFQEFFHDSVTIGCEGDYTLNYYTKSENGELISQSESIHAGMQSEIKSEDGRLKDGRIRISPSDRNCKLSVMSISRNGKTPSYRGDLEISNFNGRLIVINELPIEEYLYAVVPSEMPSSYGVEALKVQSVCARSYVVSHLGDQTLSQYGAQVDDSTDYQVYNNSGESDVAIQAVSETKGEIMKSGEEIVNAYFFATSCGSTTSARIWGGDGKPYIRGKLLCKDKENLDLSNQEAFAKFIRSDAQSFDQGNPWYRWNITYTKQQLSEIINEHLEEMSSRFPNQILVKKGDSYEKQQIKNIGTVQTITVLSRLEGGVIQELLITGSDASVKVLSQSVIRNLFYPYGVDIHKNDGTVHGKMTALPSAFFDVDNKENEITFVGGGFGHGAGMSQTAVKSMVADGMNYEEILKFFYTGIEIEKYK